MADRTRIEAPSGSPHDIAMMAYRIAERAMTHIEQHERTCGERWQIQERKMGELKDVAERNFQIGASDRLEIREALQALQAKATSLVIRGGTWLIVTMAGGLAGTIWFIITTAHH